MHEPYGLLSLVGLFVTIDPNWIAFQSVSMQSKLSNILEWIDEWPSPYKTLFFQIENKLYAFFSFSCFAYMVTAARAKMHSWTQSLTTGQMMYWPARVTLNPVSCLSVDLSGRMYDATSSTLDHFKCNSNCCVSCVVMQRIHRTLYTQLWRLILW